MTIFLRGFNKWRLQIGGEWPRVKQQKLEAPTEDHELAHRRRHPMCIWSMVITLGPPAHTGANISTSQCVTKRAPVGAHRPVWCASEATVRTTFLQYSTVRLDIKTERLQRVAAKILPECRSPVTTMAQQADMKPEG